MQEAYDKLQRPSYTIPCIHVAGTNGKGSVCGYLAQLFMQSGMKVGLYSSPHIISVVERFWLSYRQVSLDELEQELGRIIDDLGPVLEKKLSFFELMTLLAFCLFEKEKPDIIILEVGLGGRWDATNVCRSTVSVINEIGFDHTEYLGTSLAEIGSEKLGICRKDIPLFWGMKLDGSEDHNQLLALFMRRCSELEIELFRYDLDWKVNESGDFLLKSGNGFYPLDYLKDFSSVAPFMQRNFLLAYCVYKFYQKKNQKVLTEPLLFDTSKPCPPTLACRFELKKVEIIRNEQALACDLLFDVCHNVDGAKAFMEAYSSAYSPPPGEVRFGPALVTCLVDKPFMEILEILSHSFSPIIVFSNSSDRSIRENDLGEFHPSLYFKSSPAEAWELLCEIFEKRNSIIASRPIPVCGSVAGVGDFLAYLYSLPDFRFLG